MTGPLAQSVSHEIVIDFDTSRLAAGMDGLSFPAEVFSASQGAQDDNKDNNQSEKAFARTCEAEAS